MASISILPTAKLFFMAVSNISADSLLSEEVRASPYDRQQQPVLKRYALVKSNRSSVKRAVRLIAAFALPIPVIVLHRGNLLRTFFHFFYCSFSNSLAFSYSWSQGGLLQKRKWQKSGNGSKGQYHQGTASHH